MDAAEVEVRHAEAEGLVGQHPSSRASRPIRPVDTTEDRPFVADEDAATARLTRIT